MSRYIYKICPTPLWEQALQAGVFHGAGIDIQDGYIHFSTAEQSAQTLALHFTAQEGLTFIEIDSAKLAITWEASRGGQLFPHLYEPLPLSAVTNSWPLALDETGTHILPPLSQSRKED